MGHCKGTYNIKGHFAHLEKKGCGDNCYSDPVSTDGVIYSGPNLSCTGVNTCNSLTCALEKIDNKICELIDALYNLTTSTTTTSPCILTGELIDVTTITTTTEGESGTTTSTSTELPSYTFIGTDSTGTWGSSGLACNDYVFNGAVSNYYSAVSTLIIGNVLYITDELITPIDGGGYCFAMEPFGGGILQEIIIDSFGVIQHIATCPTTTTTTTTNT